MPFFEVKKREYPGSITTADNLAKRFEPHLLKSVVSVMADWIKNDRKPGRQEVELVGSEANAEMVKDVKDSMGDDVSILLVDAMQVTRCWVAVRKCGYKQMRDECFQLFVADVLESIARRK